MDERLWQGGEWEHTQSASAQSAFANRHPRRSRKKRWIRFAIPGALLAMIAVLTVATVILSQIATPNYDDPDEHGHTLAITIPRAPVGGKTRLQLQSGEGETLALQELYTCVSPSVVLIQAITEEGANLGSGVIFSEDGYILTNYHVIEGAHTAQVVFSDNTARNALLVGGHRNYDIAVLKVEADGLVPAQFTASEDVQVGDSVVAIGNPLGAQLRGTMTQGIISAVNRSMTMDGISMPMLQTTAALNSGNSGGVLVNDRGQVIGITTMKMMSRSETIEGLGFAIPTDFAKNLVDRIIATGEAKLPALGITVRAGTDQKDGIEVLDVHRSSDAWACGMRPGDVITHANGVMLTDDGVLGDMKQEMNVGDVIRLTVKRGEQVLEFTVTLMEEELFY